MSFYINENDYPQNYDWIPENKQKAIVDYVNSLYNTVRQWIDFLDKCEDDDAAIRNLWMNDSHKLGDTLLAYSAIGIKLERGWHNHGDEYALMTYDDAVDEISYIQEIDDNYCCGY